MEPETSETESAFPKLNVTEEDDNQMTSELYDAIVNARRLECQALEDNYYANGALENYCPPFFDLWSCWNATPAGTTVFVPCPHFIMGFDPKRMAHKTCTENGEWFRHPDSNATWSNYTTCVDIEDLEMRDIINNVYVTGYSISLVALVISLFILCCFRSLKCTRIYIHRNLFTSFIINNALWILWYRGILNRPKIIFNNGPGCKVLHVILHYFMVTNYFWMFCEGLYLHTLLVVAFLPENSLMKWFHLIGWGVPGLIILIYACVRASIPEETLHCWMIETRSTWILSGPVCASLLANAIFLVNIVRVLVTKLRAPTSNMGRSQKQMNAALKRSRPSSPEAYQPAEIEDFDGGHDTANGVTNRQAYAKPSTPLTSPTTSNNARSPTSLDGLRKAVRATLILLPLLGLHYLMMPFRPEPGAPGEIAYQIVSAVITSFQGLCVAFLFCFCNGEVLQVLRKRFVRYAMARQPGLNNRRLSTRSQPMTTEL